VLSTDATIKRVGINLPTGRLRSLRARRAVETAVAGSLVLAATFSVLTSFAIIFVLFGESVRFFGFEEIRVSEFLFGLEWNPFLGAEKHFGIWPLISGTVMIAAVSAVFSLPLGLITAVYLSEYAPKRLRSFLKPVLEVLAGIPTVVYGFLALTLFTPAAQSIAKMLTGEQIFESYNIFAAGLAVGIMCLPIVTSLSEDALQAVPRSLREGAYAMGSTKFDVSMKVVVPAALSGVVAAYLLAIARAVGETMIVALAAGGLAQLTINPAQPSQTMTAYMVQVFLGDAGYGTPEYYSTYAVGATLFVMTLALTLIGGRVLKKYREVYE